MSYKQTSECQLSLRGRWGAFTICSLLRLEFSSLLWRIPCRVTLASTFQVTPRHLFQLLILEHHSEAIGFCLQRQLRCQNREGKIEKLALATTLASHFAKRLARKIFDFLPMELAILSCSLSLITCNIAGRLDFDCIRHVI